MTVTTENFCHIETLEDGRKVLFYVEADDENYIIHQIAFAEIGTVDAKITAHYEKIDAAWPPEGFKVSAVKVIKLADRFDKELAQ